MKRVFTAILGLAAVVLLASCAAFSAQTPTPAAAPSPTPSAALTAARTSTARPSTTPRPTPTKARAPTATPSPTATPCRDECLLAGHFVFQRPLPRHANNRVSPTYPFESTYRGKRLPHHGVDFENPLGTPVLAAADGVVVFAGSDAQTILGAFPNFYGQAVVLRHTIPGINQPVYTLYGHVEKVLVRAGEEVRAGTSIATVGSRGVAIGPHLHFEVRLGENEYRAAKNPWLWLKPLKPNEGALAVRLTARGVPLLNHEIEVTSADGVRHYYIRTYAERGMGDPAFEENAALGDLEAGHYVLATIWKGRLYHRKAMLSPNKVTLVRWDLP